MRTIRTAIAASLLLSFSAFAADDSAAVATATLTNQDGTVLVNQGEQFITATDAQTLSVGDRVLVMEGGAAEITFADGCVLPLESGSMVSVPEASTCAGTVAQVERIGPSYAQAVGAPRNEDDDDDRLAFWLFGGWAVGIGIALSEDDKIEYPDYPLPVSP